MDYQSSYHHLYTPPASAHPFPVQAHPIAGNPQPPHQPGPHTVPHPHPHPHPQWNGAPTGTSSASLPPGALPPRAPYSSAPPSQAVSASALSGQKPLPPTFHAVTPSPGSNSATPTHAISPYAGAQSQQHRSPTIGTPQNSVMASPAMRSRSAPQSPVANAREQERVTILLQINGELLKEASNLHTQGKGGLMAQPQKSEDGKDVPQPSSREWIDCMRRIQSNLAWLTDEAQRKGHSSPGPAYMEAPANAPALADLYSKLQGVFPGWKGQIMTRPSPGPQNSNAAVTAS